MLNDWKLEETAKVRIFCYLHSLAKIITTLTMLVTYLCFRLATLPKIV